MVTPNRLITMSIQRLHMNVREILPASHFFTEVKDKFFGRKITLNKNNTAHFCMYKCDLSPNSELDVAGHTKAKCTRVRSIFFNLGAVLQNSRLNDPVTID